MRNVDGEELRDFLRRIDGRGYGAYADLPRRVELDGLLLLIDHVQGDPFAAPSRVRVRMPAERAGFAASDRETRARAVALRDFLARRFCDGCRDLPRGRGSGKSGLVGMPEPGQEILDRSAVVLLADGAVEARFVVGLPAAGRRVLGREAESLLTRAVPALAEEALCLRNLDAAALRAHLDCAEDAEALRAALPGRGLVAFVADGAILPRRSGVDDRPMVRGAVPFQSPPGLRTTIELPHAGTVPGMGLPRGVTLIVGGGYHGKSTLLAALAAGVYDHRPGDGRERVVAVSGAVKVRAEDGRAVQGVDIRAFIDRLPGGRDTAAFRSEDASGSTSQAASIVEALEVGAEALLIDEDTSATNFMIRDQRMQRLIHRDHEPITPLVDRIGALARAGVSTVLVMGGSGDYFDVADTVVGLEAYRARELTREAKAVARELPSARVPEGGGELTPPRPRRLDPRSLDPSRGRRDVALRPRGLRTLQFGQDEIELTAVEQLVDEGQVRAIGEALLALRDRAAPPTVAEWADEVEARQVAGGVASLSRRPDGDLVAVRRFELAAALSRLRSLRVLDA